MEKIEACFFIEYSFQFFEVNFISDLSKDLESVLKIHHLVEKMQNRAFLILLHKINIFMLQSELNKVPITDLKGFLERRNSVMIFFIDIAIHIHQ